MKVVCGSCGKEEGDTSTTKLKQCSVCQSVSYCSIECQKNDWASHKVKCTEKAVFRLFNAIENNNTEEIRRLHKTKRVVNGKVDFTPDFEGANTLEKWTPLHQCVRLEKSDAWDMLIQGGVANLEIKDVDGETSVFVAATSSKVDCLRMLLSSGADPNAIARDGFSPLMMASRGGYYDNVVTLLEFGASLRAGSDMFGRGALEIVQLQTTGQGIQMRDGQTMEEVMVTYKRLYELLLQYA